MMSVRNVAPFILLMLSAQAGAQSSGKIRLLIDPGATFEFKLDHSDRMQEREVELEPGPHHFSIWAPQRIVVDTTLVVLPDQTRDFVLRLPLSKEYHAYLTEYRAFRSRRQLQRIVPSVAAATFTVWSIVNWGRVKDAGEQLDADEETYSALDVPADITELKEVTIPGHNDELRKARTKAIITTALAGASAAGMVLLWNRTKGKAPVFEDKEKLRFERVSWSPDPFTGEQWFGLSLTLR